MPRPGAVGGRLKGALWSAVIASLVLSSLSGVAEASAVAGRPGNTAWVRGAGPRSFVTPSASAMLEAAYRVARAERSFELIYEVSRCSAPLRASPSSGCCRQSSPPGRSSGTSLTLKGKLVTTYVLFTAQQSCTWFAPGQAPPGIAKSATVPSCSGFNSSGYNSEIFSFLSLSHAHLAGPGQVAGTEVSGVAGNLVQSIDNDGSRSSMSWGPVTFWVGVKTSLPVAVTASADGRRVVIFKYADWDSHAVRFPTGTPS